MKQHDLTKGKVSTLFLNYLIPSISATLVTSIYVLVDTIIIGKGIGEQAVAALNILLPLFNIFFGIGLLFGVGGSVLFSVSKGEGKKEMGNQYFSHAFASALLAISLTLIGCILFYHPLLSFLGSSDETMPYIKQYAPFILAGAPIFCCSSFLQAFVRNDDDPKRSMIAVITGGVVNILLDLLFVFGFGMGMSGAALASVIGVFCTCLLLVSHFFSEINTLRLDIKKLHPTMIYRVILTGFPSFLIEIAGGIVILCFNIQLLKYSSVDGITAYSIISNTAIIITSLSNGVSQAAQPIIATNYGAKQMDRVHKTFHLALYTAGGISIVFFGIGFFVPDVFIYTYINPTPHVYSLAVTALKIYSIGFFMAALNMIICNYFQATLRQLHSLFLCLLRSLILMLGFVYTLPLLFGMNGIWMAVPIVEGITLIIGVFLLMKSKRRYELQ